MIAIYGLIDPRTGELRYIGKSANLPERIARHLRKARSGCVRHSRRWITSVLACGLTPEVEVLEEADTNTEANDAERFWIASMRLAGCRLTNLTAGGDGQAKGYRPSPEARAKQSRAELAKGGWSPEHRAAHAAALANPEVRAKMSASHKGKAPSEAARAASRAALLGKPKPQHVRDAISKANRGRKQTPEEIAKRIAATKGKVSRPPGWKHTPEAKAKIGAASRKRKSAAKALAGRWVKVCSPQE